ncbi:MAG: DUF3299 domain-containing protein [Burkholderiales bacterium]|nr:DUF3299 domain-containing protein [Burkholderiales bacterium]
MRLLPPMVIVLLTACGPATGQDYKVGDKIRQEPPKAAAPAAGAVRTLTWDDLLPPDWDPLAALKGLNIATLDDADPRAQKALEDLKRAWENAPPNRQLHGQRIRIPGFVVSLDGGPKELREFLLVPYFGACIHVPPPPPNQVIHAVARTPVKGVQTMDAVWTTGRLTVLRSDTPFGAATYVLEVERVEPYRGK